MTLIVPLVWPLSLLFLALIFRRDVGFALGRIGQVKYRDLELTFREDLHQAEQLARSIPPPAAKGSVVLEAAAEEAEPLVGRMIAPPSTTGSLPDRRDPAVTVAGRPREAIEAAWRGVALTLARASHHKRSWASTNPQLARLVSLLRALHDRASRPDQPPPCPDDARRFVDLARLVSSKIEELG